MSLHQNTKNSLLLQIDKLIFINSEIKDITEVYSNSKVKSLFGISEL